MRFEQNKHSFSFQFNSNDGDISLDMSCSELYVEDILWRFKEFLQGCGYTLDGDIQVVPWDEACDDTIQDNYDFTNIPKNNWPFGDNPPTQASEK